MRFTVLTEFSKYRLTAYLLGNHYSEIRIFSDPIDIMYLMYVWVCIYRIIDIYRHLQDKDITYSNISTYFYSWNEDIFFIFIINGCRMIRKNLHSTDKLPKDITWLYCVNCHDNLLDYFQVYNDHLFWRSLRWVQGCWKDVWCKLFIIKRWRWMWNVPCMLEMLFNAWPAKMEGKHLDIAERNWKT